MLGTMISRLAVYQQYLVSVSIRSFGARYLSHSKEILFTSNSDVNAMSQEAESKPLWTKKMILQELLESSLPDNADNRKDGSRHMLFSRLETLEKVGCTFDQILECPEILSYSEQQILYCAQKLNNYGVYKASVSLLKIANANPESRMKAKLTSHIELIFHHRTIVDFVIELLETNSLEINEIFKKAPQLKRMRNIENFVRKVQLLLDCGFTKDDMKSCPHVLCKSYSTLKYRISKLKQILPYKCPISCLLTEVGQFEKSLLYHEREMLALNGYSDRYSCLAELLMVPYSLVKEVKSMDYVRVAKIKLITDFLNSVNVPVQELVNHPYILRYSLNKIKDAYKKAQEAGFEKVTILHLINIIIMRKASQKSSTSYSSYFLRLLLKVPQSESLHNRCSEIKHFSCVDKSTLAHNLMYLESCGYSTEHIRSCPLVLIHESDALKLCVSSLPERKEVQPYHEMAEDKFKQIHFIEYFLERDKNFYI